MIERIEVLAARIPMDRPFVHATKKRTTSESVLVALDAEGERGWGEGAPRPYVTDESVDTAMTALSHITPDKLNALVDLSDFGTAMRDIAEADIVGLLGGQPAAAAALELALFDLVCRLYKRDGPSGLRCVPAAAELVRETPTPVSVSFVLDLARDPAESISRLDSVTIAAIRHVKLKATTDVADCVRRVEVVRDAFGPDTSISVDANGDWDRDCALRAARALRELSVAWLEEPVAPRDWATLREVREVGEVPVMLDESCTGIADLDAAAELDAADYINVRISKCGGLFPTLALLAAARERGMGAQLGVHVGEVGPLWAAARLVSCSVDGLATVEAGRQDEWFAEALTIPAYQIDRKTYVAEPLFGLGLGVVPNRTLLDQCTLREEK